MIPLSWRGRFFSRRTQVLMVVGLLAGYLFSAFVDLFDPQPGAVIGALRAILPGAGFFAAPNLPYALLIVFGLAAAIGLVGMHLLARQQEHPKAVEPEPFGAMVGAALRDGNFRRLLLYGLWWMLAVGIASPFWGPFMIKKLGMSLVNIQVYGTIATAASLAALRPWGALIDRSGNKAAMRLALVLGGLNPLLWVFVTPQHHELVYVEAVTSGIMWSGAGLVATNFVLAIAPESRRQVYSGLFGAFSGVAMMVTMLLSGPLLPPPVQIGPLHLEGEQVLFAITALARWSTQLPLSWVREPQARPLAVSLAHFWHSLGPRLARLRRRPGPLLEGNGNAPGERGRREGGKEDGGAA